MRFENLITVVVISESKNEGKSWEISISMIIQRVKKNQYLTHCFCFLFFLLRTPKFRAIHSSVKLRNPEVQTKQCCC